MNSVIAIAPIASSVLAAFRPGGGRKALTPFEIASTPVSAAAPEAKAWSSTNTPTAPAPAAIGCGACTVGHSPVAHFPTPVPTSRNIDATNAYVGSANRAPDSRTPRRLASVSMSDEGEAERDLVPAERGGGGREREDSGGDGDGHGQDVVDEQGRGRDEARHRPEVLARDDVGAAARLVRVDGLDVREDDDRHHGRDRDRHRQDVMAGRRGRADQDDERRLGRVGDGRERVGGEDREGEPLGEQRLVHLPARAGSADQSSLERKRAGAHDPTLGRAASVRSQDFGATNRYPTPVSVSR